MRDPTRSAAHRQRHERARRLLGERPFTAGGLITAGIGLLEMVLWHHGVGMLAGLAITGLGIGAFTPANNATIMAAAPAKRTGLVSGVLNMTRGFGTALGVAIASTLYTAAAGVSGAHAAGAGRHAAGHGLDVALAVLGITALLVGLSLLARGPDDGARAVRRRGLSVAPGTLSGIQ